jgi:nucleotide-binding universal stress UspA family protein
MIQAIRDFLTVVEAGAQWHYSPAEREELQKEQERAKATLLDEIRGAAAADAEHSMGATFPSPFKRILVAVDGDEPSRQAARLASAFAADPSVRVAVVNVIDPARGLSPEFAFVDESLLAEFRPKAGELLKQVSMEFPSAAPPERLVRVGNPAAEIISVASEWDADLIVMGTHSRGSLAHLLLGGTTEAVLRRAPCPVLVEGAARRTRPAITMMTSTSVTSSGGGTSLARSCAGESRELDFSAMR